MTSAKDAAKEILEILQSTYQGQDTVVPAVEADFPHLDFTRYSEAEQQLASFGFRKLGDVELVNFSNDPESFYKKTLIRSFVSKNGEIVASCYEIRPRWSRLFTTLLNGLLAFRWIATPLFVLSVWRPRLIYSFGTEFSDGSFVLTSNAEGEGLLSCPPSIDALRFPYNTNILYVLESHRARLAKSLNMSKAKNVRPAHTAEECRETQNRLTQQINAHRAALSWITKTELTNIAGQPKLANKVFEEIQKLLKEKDASG